MIVLLKGSFLYANITKGIPTVSVLRNLVCDIKTTLKCVSISIFLERSGNSLFRPLS